MDAFCPTLFPRSEIVGNVQSEQDYYQHICAMMQYQNYSPEELRLNDYKSDRVLSTLHSGLLLAMYNSMPLPTAPRLEIMRSYTRYGSKIITFEVGKEDQQSFAIHESLLTHRSEFVRLALQNDWKEAKERCIPLPEDNPKIFEMYQIFLYDHDIYNTDNLDQYQMLVKAYILGEKLFDIGFKNAVIDAIIIKLRNSSHFDPQLTNLVYDNTAEKAPLRKLLRDIYVWTGRAKWFDEKDLEEPINAEFMRDVNEAQFNARHCPSQVVPDFLNDQSGWNEYHEQVKSTGADAEEHRSITPKTWKIRPW